MPKSSSSRGVRGLVSDAQGNRFANETTFQESGVWETLVILGTP